MVNLTVLTTSKIEAFEAELAELGRAMDELIAWEHTPEAQTADDWTVGSHYQALDEIHARVREIRAQMGLVEPVEEFIESVADDDDDTPLFD
jgi:hypothetical protein